MSLATLSGFTVTSCRVHLPKWGAWYAEVEIDRAEAFSGAVTLVLSDVTFRGAVVSGGVWATRARYRIVGGSGGWGKSIKAQSYSNDLGVTHAKIVGDAARECGETIGVVPVAVAGPSFVRAEGRAANVLEQLVPSDWYVDEAGVTQFGSRTARVFTGVATRLKFDAANGVLDIAAEKIATLVPGVIVDGLEAIDVEHALDVGALRTTIWGNGGHVVAASLPDNLRLIVGLLTASHRYYAPWEYRVVERVSERYHLQPVRVSTGLPSLRNVRVRGGVAGCRTHLTLGSLVLVSFVDGNPARPVITGFDDPDSPGFAPVELALGSATASDPVVRKSDLQAALNSIQSKYDVHVHPAGSPNTSAPTVLLGTQTATGSSVVKGA